MKTSSNTGSQAAKIAVKATPTDAAAGEGAQGFSFLQSRVWAEFKARYGWQPFFFNLEVQANGDVRTLPITVLVRRFFKVFSLAYIPMAPNIPLPDELKSEGKEDEARSFYAQILAKTAAAIKGFLPRNVFCIRFDPPFEEGALEVRALNESVGQSKLKSMQFGTLPAKVLKATSDIQPPDTVLIDLAQELDSILARMKPKWRYNIRLAEKKGVKVLCFKGAEALSTGINVQSDLPTSANPDNPAHVASNSLQEASPLDIFYRLYLETAERDGIVIHTKEYYKTLFFLCSEDATSDLRIYIAESEGTPLAAIITLFYAGEATYLYGASSAEKRSLMPAYALQWQAIKDAKAALCTQYDFYGIPPTDDESHPMHGLYRFKTGFGGRVVHRWGSIDVPCKKGIYSLYRVAERARLVWFKKARKALKRKSRVQN